MREDSKRSGKFVESMASGCYCSFVLVESEPHVSEHGAAPSLPDSSFTSIVGKER